MQETVPGAGARKVAVAALLAVSLLHLPVIYLVIRHAEDAPPYALVPLIMLAVGAAWAGGSLLEGRRSTLPYLAGGLSLLELPVVALAPGPAGLEGTVPLAWFGAIAAAALVTLVALLARRRAKVKDARPAP